MSTVTFDLIFVDNMNEDVKIRSKKYNTISIRINQETGSTAKNHATNIKVFVSDNKDGNFQVPVDPKTMLLDRDYARKDIRSKDQLKAYKDSIDAVGGALLYAKNEFQDFLKRDKEREYRSDEEIQKKLDEFSKLMDKNDPKFKKYCKYAKEGRTDVDESFFDKLEFI